MYWHITASHNPGEAIYDGPINRSVLDSAIYFDTVIPHDQEFRFDVYCPEDVSTCDIIEEKSKPFLARVETPDPPFSSICVSPRSECGTDCIELASSPTHCGSCNNTCQTGESCESGVCAVRTPPVWGENDTPYDTSGCQMSQAGVGQTPGQSIWWLGIGGLSLALAGRVIRAAKAR